MYVIDTYPVHHNAMIDVMLYTYLINYVMPATGPGALYYIGLTDARGGFRPGSGLYHRIQPFSRCSSVHSKPGTECKLPPIHLYDQISLSGGHPEFLQG